MLFSACSLHRRPLTQATAGKATVRGPGRFPLTRRPAGRPWLERPCHGGREKEGRNGGARVEKERGDLLATTYQGPTACLARFELAGKVKGLRSDLHNDTTSAALLHSCTRSPNLRAGQAPTAQLQALYALLRFLFTRFAIASARTVWLPYCMIIALGRRLSFTCRAALPDTPTTGNACSYQMGRSTNVPFRIISSSVD